jgi:signal transduction histidine kinase
VIGQLAGGIAHVSNNMLIGILGANEFGKTVAAATEALERFDTVIDASNRAAAFTRQLLSFARRGSARMEALEFNRIAQNTLSLFKRMASPKIVVHAELTSNPDVILGDPTLLQNALMNLLVTARDAIPNGGHITVATDLATLTELETSSVKFPLEAGHSIRFIVSDTVIGIPPESQSRIFEPSYTTKEIGKGTGLGLAAVVRLCSRSPRHH